jgi:hypothetical protein
MNKAPRKWQKHQLLVDFGLRTQEDLQSSITRYNIDDNETMFNDIENDMQDDMGENVYIGICVPQERFFNLPNFKIISKEDIKQAKETLNLLGTNNFAEIWYCKNSLQQGESLYGRIAFALDELFPRIAPDITEVIKGNTTRELEDATKHIEIPEIIKEHLASYKNKIADFGEFLKSTGCKQFALEFSYINDNFKFIDWDSDNDKKVLGFLENKLADKGREI